MAKANSADCGRREGKIMRKTMLALVALGSIYVAGSSPAAAFDYPYCLTSQKDGTDCSYSTYHQCVTSASGRGADCIVNPVVAFAQQYPQPPRQRRARRASDY
jgi:hypothetical protein